MKRKKRLGAAFHFVAASAVDIYIEGRGDYKVDTI